MGDDEDSRPVGISEDDGIARVLRRKPRERIQVGLVTDVKPMPFDGRVQLHRLEQLARVARENGDAVRRRPKFGFQVGGDPSISR